MATRSYRARWFLRSQAVTLQDTTINIEETTLLRSESSRTTVPVTDIGTSPFSTRTRASVLWPIVAGFFLLGALSNLFGRDENWLGDFAVGSAIAAGLAGYWLVQRVPWVGLPGLPLIDRGAETQEFLQAVRRVQNETLLQRIEQRSSAEVPHVIADWRREGLIDEAESSRLRRIFLDEPQTPSDDRDSYGYL